MMSRELPDIIESKFGWRLPSQCRLLLFPHASTAHTFCHVAALLVSTFHFHDPWSMMRDETTTVTMHNDEGSVTVDAPIPIRFLPCTALMTKTRRSLPAIRLILLIVFIPLAPILLHPAGHVEHHGVLSFYHRRAELSIATASFILATSLRTTIMTPLQHFGQNTHHLEERGRYSLLTVIVHTMEATIDRLELFSHNAWEDAARKSGTLRDDADNDGSSSTALNDRHHNVPEIDLNLLVPCKLELARIQVLGIGTNDDNDANNNEGDDPDLKTTMECHHGEPPCIGSICSNGGVKALSVCRLRDVITQSLLVEYAKTLYDESFELATHPIILRNLWPPDSFDDATAVIKYNSSGSSPFHSIRTSRKLTPDAILNDPQLSNLQLPNYFSDAANKTGYAALVPDITTSHLTLSQFLRGVLSGEFPNSKIGTQLIIEQFPELKNEIIPPSLAKELFGWNTLVEDYKMRIKELFHSEKIGSWVMKLVPPMSYYPVFIASNQQTTDGTTQHPRTDLHAEPIGNIASQLHGERRWTLVPTKWSSLLRPTISRRRGYFFSNIEPLSELPKRLYEMIVSVVRRIIDVYLTSLPYLKHDRCGIV